MITYKEVGLAEQKTTYGRLAGQCISVPQTVEETSPKTLSKYCEDNKRKNLNICRISSIDPGDTCTEHSIVRSKASVYLTMSAININLVSDVPSMAQLSVIGTGYRSFQFGVT